MDSVQATFMSCRPGMTKYLLLFTFCPRCTSTAHKYDGLRACYMTLAGIAESVPLWSRALPGRGPHKSNIKPQWSGNCTWQHVIIRADLYGHSGHIHHLAQRTPKPIEAIDGYNTAAMMGGCCGDMDVVLIVFNNMAMSRWVDVLTG